MSRSPNPTDRRIQSGDTPLAMLGCNATADRMVIEANRHLRETVQLIVDAVATTHTGSEHAEVVAELRSRWTQHVGATAATPEEKLHQYAAAISAGNRVSLLPDPQAVPADHEWARPRAVSATARRRPVPNQVSYNNG
jgi:hypothetical protein